MYQRKVDVDMLNAVKCVLADVSSVSPSSEQKKKGFFFKEIHFFSVLASTGSCFQNESRDIFAQ